MRIAIRYARSGPAVYTSHLDMQRAFGRAVRRARIPALYSQGFNPHLIMSFASPLSVGSATDADYLELEVEDSLSLRRAFEALAASMPPGLELRGLYRIPQGTKKLMALNDSASYEVRFETEDPAELQRIAAAAASLGDTGPHLCLDRKGRELDLGELILSVDAGEGGTVRLTTANASGRSLNPDTAAREILRRAGSDVPFRIRRTECFAEQDGHRIPFRKLFPECIEIK